jgi:formylglycine-generating enzyme required for sulfatase activity
MDEEGRRLAERTRGTATPSGVSISELAQQLSLSGPMLMRKARDVFGRDIRTPSHVLTADQAEELRARFGAGTLTDKPATGALPLPPIRLDLGEGVFLDLVGIPPGRFTMGSPLNEEGHNNDEVEHNVKISRPFYLGRHLISQAQYEQAMKSNPSYFKDPALPVETVSWFDAVSFCEELFTRFGKPFRLPTEAEWEYACRAGTTTPFNTGATMNTDQANFDGKFTFGGSLESLSRWRTTPVGSFSPNSWGLYDMHGNVWEWCSDWYGEYTQTPVTDPQGPPVGAIRILRGGSWFHGPADCRSAQREALDPGRRHSPYGFRVAMGSV